MLVAKNLPKHSESTENKRSGGLIRRYYDEIKEADAVLLMNVPKRGISGYIGGNAFLEYGFAHVLDKIIYLMFPYNETSPYSRNARWMRM